MSRVKTNNTMKRIVDAAMTVLLLFPMQECDTEG